MIARHCVKDIIMQISILERRKCRPFTSICFMTYKQIEKQSKEQTREIPILIFFLECCF